jgi:hypothetical protein
MNIFAYLLDLRYHREPYHNIIGENVEEGLRSGGKLPIIISTGFKHFQNILTLANNINYNKS